MIYIVIGCILFSLALLERGNWHTPKSAVSLNVLTQFLFIIFFSLFVGFREGVGGDWGSYDEIFHLIDSTDYPSYLFLTDPGYAFVNKIISHLDLTVHYVNFICASIFFVAAIKVSFSFPRPLFSISMAYGYLIPVVAMGMTRQSVSVGLGMLALLCFSEAKYYRATLFGLIAISFHRSAIFVAFICLLAINKRFSFKLAILLILSSLFVLIDGFQFAYLIYYNYLDAGHQSSGAVIRTGILSLSAIIYLIKIRNSMLNQEYRKVFDALSFLSLVTFAISLAPSLSTFADRFSFYLMPIILMAPVVMRTNRPNAKLPLPAVSLLLAHNVFFFIWILYSQYAQYWLPYKNFLFG